MNTWSQEFWVDKTSFCLRGPWDAFGRNKHSGKILQNLVAQNLCSSAETPPIFFLNNWTTDPHLTKYLPATLADRPVYQMSAASLRHILQGASSPSLAMVFLGAEHEAPSFSRLNATKIFGFPMPTNAPFPSQRQEIYQLLPEDQAVVLPEEDGRKCRIFKHRPLATPPETRQHRTQSGWCAGVLKLETEQGKSTRTPRCRVTSTELHSATTFFSFEFLDESLRNVLASWRSSKFTPSRIFITAGEAAITHRIAEILPTHVEFAAKNFLYPDAQLGWCPFATHISMFLQNGAPLASIALEDNHRLVVTTVEHLP